MKKSFMSAGVLLAFCLLVLPLVGQAEESLNDPDEGASFVVPQEMVTEMGGAGQFFLEDLPPKENPDVLKDQAAAWIEKLKVLESEKKYGELVARVREFRQWLTDNKGNSQYPTSGDAMYKEHLAGAYNFELSGLGGQGYYGAAANVAREAYQKVKEAQGSTAGLFEKAATFESQRVLRNELLQKNRDYYAASGKLEKELLERTAEKQKLIDELAKQSSITPQNLKDLQAKIKEINQKIEPLIKKAGTLAEEFKKIQADEKYAGILFNPELRAEVDALVKVQTENATRYQQADVALKESLAKLAVTAGQSWQGLDNRIDALTKQQKEIKALQKQLLELLGKKPYSEDSMKKIRELNARLDSLSAEYAQNLQGLEADFMNSSVFTSLSPDQKAEFQKKLSAFMESKKEIDSGNAKIDELIAGMEKQTGKLGDLNGDGKIDKADLKLLTKNIGKKAGKVPFGDLDGDGKITASDANYLKEAIAGTRKVFPADPAFKPGDLNGSGELDIADVMKLARAIAKAGKKGIKVRTPRQKSMDFNKDGVVDWDDLKILLEKVRGFSQTDTATGTGTGAQTDTGAPADGTTAPATGDRADTGSSAGTDTAAGAAGGLADNQ